MTMKAIAAPFPVIRTVEMPPRRQLLAERNEMRAVRSNDALVELFDAIIVEAYGVALTQVQSPRRAEQVTNRVVDRLAVAIRRNPAIDEEALRSLAYQSMHKELSAHVARPSNSQRLQGLRASTRHLFLVGSMAFATSYALIAGAI